MGPSCQRSCQENNQTARQKYKINQLCQVSRTTLKTLSNIQDFKIWRSNQNQQLLSCSDSINRKLPPSLQDQFHYIHGNHAHQTKLSTQYCVKVPKWTITGQSARSWNFFHMEIKKNLHIMSRPMFKEEITKFIFNSY